MEVTYVGGIPVEGKSKCKTFVAVTWDQIQAFGYFFPGKSKLWVVFFLIVHCCQAKGRRTIHMGRRLYDRANISRRTVYRAINELESRGVITTRRARGRSIEITLSDRVPLRFRGRKT